MFQLSAHRLLIVGSALSAALLTVPVSAQDLLIGGSQYSRTSSYTYLGLIKPVWGGELGSGWFTTAMGSWLTYEYDVFVDDRSNQRLKARAPGLDLGLGYGWRGERYSLGLSLAAGYRDYRLSPDLSSEQPRGSTLTLTPQLQAGYQISDHWDLGLLSNLTIGPQSQFNRLRLGTNQRASWHIGLEGFYQQGRNYRIKQYGLFATRYLSNGLALELSAGQLESQDVSSAGYIGFAFARSF